MIAVIFELWPTDRQAYFDLAAALRSELATFEGFISIERFQNLADDGKYLSLSFWRSESDVAAWRRHEAHRLAQTRGRDSILSAYRLRVANVTRDYTLTDRADAPADSRLRHA